MRESFVFCLMHITCCAVLLCLQLRSVSALVVCARTRCQLYCLMWCGVVCCVASCLSALQCIGVLLRIRKCSLVRAEMCASAGPLCACVHAHAPCVCVCVCARVCVCVCVCVTACVCLYASVCARCDVCLALVATVCVVALRGKACVCRHACVVRISTYWPENTCFNNISLAVLAHKCLLEAPAS